MWVISVKTIRFQFAYYGFFPKFSTYHKDLKKQGDLRNSVVLLGLTPLWHVPQWVSRAPTHHTSPVFLTLNGRLIWIRLIRTCLFIGVKAFHFCSKSSLQYFQKISQKRIVFTAYGLHRDHSQCWSEEITSLWLLKFPS